MANQRNFQVKTQVPVALLDDESIDLAHFIATLLKEPAVKEMKKCYFEQAQRDPTVGKEMTLTLQFPTHLRSEGPNTN